MSFFLSLVVLGGILDFFAGSSLGTSNFFCFARRSRLTKLRSPIPLAPKKVGFANIAERGLLNDTLLSAKSILDNCQTTQAERYKNCQTQLLGFVTPWNKAGYDAALANRRKFNIVVPVWYNIVFVDSCILFMLLISIPHSFRPGNPPKLTGGDDVNTKWLKQMKVKDGNLKELPKIIPRVHFDQWSDRTFLNFLQNEKQMDAFVKLLLKECNTYHFEGIFLDFAQLSFMSIPPDRASTAMISELIGQFYKFLARVGSQLHANELELHLAIAVCYFRPISSYSPLFFFQNPISFTPATH
jgi:hypothetical protein